jgi:hypothetical protein
MRSEAITERKRKNVTYANATREGGGGREKWGRRQSTEIPAIINIE